MIWRKGWAHPILNIVLGQILIAIARQGKFWFSNSSDDVCFLFYINPSSTVCPYTFHVLYAHFSSDGSVTLWIYMDPEPTFYLVEWQILKTYNFLKFIFQFFLFTWFGHNVFIFIFKIHSHPGSRSIICYGFGSGKFVLIRFRTCATSEPTRQLTVVLYMLTDLQCTKE